MKNHLPNDLDSIIQQAHILSAEGNVDEVGHLLENGVRQNPHSIELLAHLGYYYYKRGRLSRSLEIFHRLNALQTPDVGICDILAQIYSRSGDFIHERQWLQQAKEKGFDKPLTGRIVRSYLRERISSIRQRLTRSRILLGILQWIRNLQAFGSTLVLRGLETVIPTWLEPEPGTNPFDLGSYLRFARRFDSLYRRDGLAYHKIREILLASRNLPIHDNQAIILDIGTGLNSVPLLWSTHGAQVIALDGSTYGFSHLKMVESKSRQEGHAHSIHYTVGDGIHLPFASDSVDGVSALCMLEHIPEDGDIRCMEEIYRVVRPGGVAVITVETSRQFTDCWLEVSYPIGFQSGKDVEKLNSQSLHEVYCRNYSPEQMMKRLAGSASWGVVYYGFYDEWIFPIRCWLAPSHPFAPWLRAKQPLLALLNYRPCKQEDRLSPSSIGYLVLRKPQDMKSM